MNRAQRRALGKQNTRADQRMMANIGRMVDQDRKDSAAFSSEIAWKMMIAAVGLCLHDKGKSDDEIGDFLFDVQATLDRELDEGEDANSLVQKLEEKTGIVLEWRKSK